MNNYELFQKEDILYRDKLSLEIKISYIITDIIISMRNRPSNKYITGKYCAIH